MPAYIGNGDAQFFLFIELAGGDDEKVLVEQRSHKTSLFGLADLGGAEKGSGVFYSTDKVALAPAFWNENSLLAAALIELNPVHAGHGREEGLSRIL